MVLKCINKIIQLKIYFANIRLCVSSPALLSKLISKVYMLKKLWCNLEEVDTVVIVQCNELSG